MWLKANLVNERLLDTDPNEIAVMSVDDLDGYLSNFDRETLDVINSNLENDLKTDKYSKVAHR